MSKHLSEIKPVLWKNLTEYFGFYEYDDTNCLTDVVYHHYKNDELNIALEISIYGEDYSIEVDCVNPTNDWEGKGYEDLCEASTIPEIIAALKKIKQSTELEQFKTDLKQTKTIKQTKKETTMTTALNIIKSSNLSSAQVAAKITLGKTANKIIISKVKPMLPWVARGYTDHPLASVVIANAANYIIKSRYPENKKAAYVAEALMDSSMLTLVEHFNIDEIISSFINEVKIPAALKSEIIEEDDIL